MLKRGYTPSALHCLILFGLKGLCTGQALRRHTTCKQISKPNTSQVLSVGDLVDVTGVSKGKGFAGVMKRHGFRGGPATHGQSDRARAPGSIGATTTPGRVFKGLRMAGRMGNERVIVQNLKVVLVDPERNLLGIRGSIPGNRGGLVMVQKAVKSR